jgi:hypothetical protein
MILNLEPDAEPCQGSPAVLRDGGRFTSCTRLAIRAGRSDPNLHGTIMGPVTGSVSRSVSDLLELRRRIPREQHGVIRGTRDTVAISCVVVPERLQSVFEDGDRGTIPFNVPPLCEPSVRRGRPFSMER